MSEYIFIRIPRTGSTSICKALNNYPDHMIASKWKEITPDWNERFKFTIVRNPYDRFISMYNYFGEVPLDKFMEEKIYEKDLRFKPQVDYLDEKIDFIGRYEDLDNAWEYIRTRLGLDEIKLDWLKKTKHIELSHKETIYKYYEKDFKLFNYV